MARVGRNRRAFDRSVRAALKNPNEEQRLDAELDAGLVAAGRGIADHLDNTLHELVVKLEEFAESAEPHQVTRLADAIEKLSQRIDKAIYTTPHLMNILREMYATPKARVDAARAKERIPKDEKPKDDGGSVSRFRSIAGGKAE